jgi:pantothenate synthetase
MKTAQSEGNQKVANDASVMIVKCNTLITKSENADSYYNSGVSALNKGNYILAYTNLAEAEKLYKELGFTQKEKLAHDKKIEASTLNNAQNELNDQDDKYSDYSGIVQVLRQALGGFSTILAKIMEALQNQG